MLFDSLNRLALGAYGGTAISTPNFDRFAARAVTFDKHYVGSLPCMPARRDMHTGRLNFMHRPWGPLEPFDNSYAKLLSKNGIYSHIVSDHLHYFENGGTGYVTAFDSWDFIRGQEYDPIEVMVRPPVERIREKFDSRHYPTEDLRHGRVSTRGTSSTDSWRRSRHAVNTFFMNEEDDFPTAKCFKRAFSFLDLNQEFDDWFLQIECFDPHEPFTAPARFKKAYETGYEGKILDWPIYEKVSNSTEKISEIRGNYAALTAMCDEYFGQLLDWMDSTNAWDNTALILSTDHGFLLGEHEWWGKNKMPYYEEISHIPLMIAHPEAVSRAGTRVSTLTQTTDLMPTILELHGIDAPIEKTSYSLVDVVQGSEGQRNAAILGMFAGPICVTDGRYTYFRFPVDLASDALPLYTVMPSHLENQFSVEELQSAELSPPFNFTKGAPVMRMRMSSKIGETGRQCVANWDGTSMLYDLKTDPYQKYPIENQEVVKRLTGMLMAELERHDAPEEIYAHYGLETPVSAGVAYAEETKTNFKQRKGT